MRALLACSHVMSNLQTDLLTCCLGVRSQAELADRAELADPLLWGAGTPTRAMP